MGFTLDIWDYLMFATVALLIVAFMVLLVFILGLPGRIAIARKHPEAEAVNMMGWLGFMAIVPWVQALIWSIKPTDVIDIRNFPKEERREIEENIARLTGKAKPEPDATPPPKTNSQN